MRPSPSSCRLGLRGYSLSGSPRVHLRYGPATRTPPAEGVVNGLQVIRFPSCLPSSYGASDCYPDGTDPRWTQQPFLDAQLLVSLSISSSSPVGRPPLGSGNGPSRPLRLSATAPPVPLRPVMGFPHLRLLRGLRDPGTRVR